MISATPAPRGPDKLNADDLLDVQGLVVRGYNLPQVRHFVLTIGDVAAALAFFKALTTSGGQMNITSAKPWPGGEKPPYALNLGLSAAGLEALHLPASELNFNQGNFGPFLGSAVNAAKRIGDTGSSAPSQWLDKLNQDNASAAHLILSLYTKGEAARERYSVKLRDMFSSVIPAAGIPHHDVLEFDVDAMILTEKASGRKLHRIHFGYTDGISNPIIDADGLPALRSKQLPYVPAWQFVLRKDGNTYNIPTPPAFTQNASFSAFRILEQDVSAFERFLATRADDVSPEHLAAKMCGRWRNGNPLVVSPNAPGSVELPDALLRDFDYGSDTVGEPCPYSAQTRRLNPRGGPGVTGVHNTDQGRQNNRIMRRANPYCPVYTGTPDAKPRGLAGHFIGVSLQAQFEFLMQSWVNDNAFPGLAAKAGFDPLLGASPPGSTFTSWSNHQPHSVDCLSRFVTTRGGLYCMLPSITGIKWIAANGNQGDYWRVPTIPNPIA